MRPAHRTLAGLVAVVIAAVVVVALGSPSQAEPKRLLVATSPSGPFVDNLATPLFGAADRLVPLARESSRFWVKNNSSQPARATLMVVNRAGSNDFERALSYEIRVGGTRAVAILPDPDRHGCRLAATGPNIAPGATQPVDVAAQLADLVGRAGTDQTASVDFVLTLSQVGPTGQIQVCGEQAIAQPPQVRGGHEGDCSRDVVVTTTGVPTCVPSAVSAGQDTSYDAVPARGAGLAGLLAVSLLAGGATTLLLAVGRRRRESAHPGGAQHRALRARG